MVRHGLIAALLVVAVGLVWLIATADPAATERDQDPDGAFEASVDDPTRVEPQPQPGASQPLAAAPQPKPLAFEEPKPAPAPDPMDENLLPRQGPIEAMTHRFETEPRDSAAGDVEALVHDAFKRESVPPELLKSVLCRQTVCKVELRMKPPRMQGYLKAMTELVETRFASDVAVVPDDAVDSDHVRSVAVFLQKRPAPPPP